MHSTHIVTLTDEATLAPLSPSPPPPPPRPRRRHVTVTFPVIPFTCQMATCPNLMVERREMPTSRLDVRLGGAPAHRAEEDEREDEQHDEADHAVLEDHAAE